MEKHFLDGQFEGPQEFRPEPWYNPYGDCIQYLIADEAPVADRIDDILTIYRSAIDNRPIGYQIKDVLALIKEFGWDGLASVTALFLAAYESLPRTMTRRAAYASAMQYPTEKRLCREELVPA